MKYLLDFKNDTSQQDIDNYLQNNGCTVLQTWDNFDKIYLVEVNVIPPAHDILERMTEEVPLKIKPLIAINPHWQCHEDPTKPKITLSTSDEKDWWKNYSYMSPKFELPEYEISRLGKHVNIYLMDSGIEKTHPEFVDAEIIDLYSVVPGNYSDSNGHGTSLASVMVGKTCGITDATVKNVKIFDSYHDTLQSEFLSALDAIINDHVDGRFAVCNCSWIIPKNEWIEHKLQILNNEGVFIMAAAGNQGTTIEDVTPASMMEALTVGAYNKDLEPCDFSNYTGGSIVSVTGGSVNHGALDGWAPGEQIWAAGLNGTYGYVAGTSIATAIASAVTASNISWFINDDKQVFNYYNEAVSLDSVNAAGYNGFVFNKKQLLDFSKNPKYEESKNLITGLYDKCANLNIQFPDEVNIKIQANFDKIVNLGAAYNPNSTKNIEWLTPLPENFELLPDGLIIGKPGPDQGPSDNQQYRKFEATLNRTNLDDTVELVTINIFIFRPDIDKEQLPEDDPIIPILLQAPCNTNAGYCVLQTQFSCSPACGGGTPCCAINCSKMFYWCYCTWGC